MCFSLEMDELLYMLYLLHSTAMLIPNLNLLIVPGSFVL